jgi:5-methylcytosine-specific restriction endonuclease McrA
VHHRDHAVFGQPSFYDIDNLEALCRHCHRRAGAEPRVG